MSANQGRHSSERSEESTHIPQVDSAAPHQQCSSFLRRYLFSTDHRTIGKQYLALAFIAVAIGTLLSS